MTKIAFFENEDSSSLQGKVNKFIADKEVINVSFSAHEGWYYCCVLYKD